MKKIFPLFSILILSILFINEGVLYAQQPAEVPQDAPVGVVVAEVNIQDVQIVSQEGNVIKINFSLNNGKSAQTGVQYGVLLIKEEDDKQVVVDEIVYDEILTLAEYSTTKRSIIYTAPALFSGEYTLLLTSKNAQGFPFGVTTAGSVMLTASEKGLMINPDSCRVSVQGQTEQYPLLKSVELSSDDTMQMVCTVTNTVGQNISAVPFYTTRYNGSYGAVVSSVGGDSSPVLFVSGVEMNITLALPKVSAIGSYAVSVTFEGLGALSNTVTAHYTIPGSSLKIVNATLDKDYYAKGESAVASVLWMGTVNSSVVVNAQLKGDNGRLCAKEYSQTVLLDPSTPISIPFSLVRNCFNPNLILTAVNEGGVVLDTQEFSFITTSTARPLLPWKTIGMIIGGLILIAGVGMYIKHKKLNHETPV